MILTISQWFLSTLLVTVFRSSRIGVNAYIPAFPTNASFDPVNETSPSRLRLKWFGGLSVQNVSYALASANSSGTDQGAIVHFSENMLTNDTTTTPWIALVACDANATDASDTDDIFTLARDRGAVAALLYSLHSTRCEITPAYADPANFDNVMDIFATTSLDGSQFIEIQFGAINETEFGHFDANLLNQSAAEIGNTIANGTVLEKGFMVASLVAYNATGDNGTASGGSNNSSPGMGSGGSTPTNGGTASGRSNTSLAMYAGIALSIVALSGLVL